MWVGNITAIVLMTVNSKGSPRAPSVVHQFSHTQWPLLIQRATPGPKTQMVNRHTITMLQKCRTRLPCLIADGDIVFHRHIKMHLQRALNVAPPSTHALHLCPGCLYNRYPADPSKIWQKLPPERNVTGKKDSSGLLYMESPFDMCWYGGPVAALFLSKAGIDAAINAFIKWKDTPCDVVYNMLPHHYPLVTPLCREGNARLKDDPNL